MKLTIKGCKVNNLTLYPKAVEGKPTNMVLVIQGLLTPQLADDLDIGGCYSDNGIPQHWGSFPSPTLQIEDAGICLNGDVFRPRLITKLKVTQAADGGDNDVSLTLTLRMHFDFNLPLIAWVDNQQQNEFVTIVEYATQSELFDNEGNAADVEDGEAAPEAARQTTISHQRKRGHSQKDQPPIEGHV